MNASAPLTGHQRRVLELHLDPDRGSRYWLERAAGLRHRIERLETHGELRQLFGAMEENDLRSRPVRDFVPRSLQDDPRVMILGETGGATGIPKRTVYLEEEFHQAFVEPFVRSAARLGFPRGVDWLWVGPSGPHIIGKAAPRLAAAMDSADPFSVDFDPRWARILAPGSLARDRYLSHVVDQAMAVLNREEVGVIFTTPSVLETLAKRMTAAQREAIAAVHYGGQRLEQDALRRFQCELFPRAVHLSGYGNTLFGCCLELDVTAGRTPTYYPFGERLVFYLGDLEDGADAPAAGDGPRRVHFSRFDRGFMILNMPERDVARPAVLPAGAPEGFCGPGLSDPRPPETKAETTDAGLY